MHRIAIKTSDQLLVYDRDLHSRTLLRSLLACTIRMCMHLKSPCQNLQHRITYGSLFGRADRLHMHRFQVLALFHRAGINVQLGDLKIRCSDEPGAFTSLSGACDFL